MATPDILVIRDWIDKSLSPDGNGEVASSLNHLFSSFEQIGIAGGSIPILRSPPLGVANIDDLATRQFMNQVVEAGDPSGVDLFVGGDPALGRFRAVATTGFAIEMLLNPPDDADPEKWNIRVMGTEAARSVVERKALVQSVLTAHGVSLLQQDSGLRLKLLSIASGVGRCPFDVIGELHKVAPGRVGGLFVDNDEEVVAASQELVYQRGWDDQQVTVEHKNFFALSKIKQNSIHLIEATGFTDYFNDNQVSRVFRICRRLVSENGVVVVTNITSSREQAYLDIVWGKMHRRTPARLADLAISAGFAVRGTALILDSTETMCTVVTRP